MWNTPAEHLQRQRGYLPQRPGTSDGALPGRGARFQQVAPNPLLCEANSEGPESESPHLVLGGRGLLPTLCSSLLLGDRHGHPEVALAKLGQIWSLMSYLILF